MSDVLPLLSKNKLALLQLLDIEPSGNVLITKLIHEGGETIQSKIAIPAQADPQKLGSLITYLKRYSLQAMLGIATEDDDGNSAMPSSPKAPPKSTETRGEFTTKKEWDHIAQLAQKKNVDKPFCKTMAEYRKAVTYLTALPDAK